MKIAEKEKFHCCGDFQGVAGFFYFVIFHEMHYLLVQNIDIYFFLGFYDVLEMMMCLVMICAYFENLWFLNEVLFVSKF